jgi:hypothetical protein
VLRQIDDLDDISALEVYVQQSALILAFLSRGYFSSVNCLRELHGAVAAAKPMLSVHEETLSHG